MKRTLLINFGRMGDILQTSSLITYLKERHPGLTIGLLGASNFNDVMAGIPGVDTVHPVDLPRLMQPLQAGDLFRDFGMFKEFLEELAFFDYDTIFNLTHNRLGSILSSLLPGEVVGLTLDNEGMAVVENPWMRYFYNTNINRGFNQFNLVDLYKLSAGFEGGQSTPDNSRLRFNVEDGAKLEADKMLASAGIDRHQRIIGFQPGASADSKRWPVEYWNRLGQSLAKKYRVAVFGSSGEVELARETVKGVEGAVNFAGKTTIPLLAALLEKCSLLISNDTGTQHLAASMGKKALSLALGPALASETGPYGAGHIIIEPVIECGPCNYKHPCLDFACHRLIKPEYVEIIAEAMLAGESIDRSIDIDGQMRISCTGFDRHGLWEMRQVNSGGNTFRERVNAAYRAAWLELANGYNTTIYDANISGEGIALELDEVVSSTRSLIESAGRGETEAERLAHLAGKTPPDIDSIKQVGDGIAEIDDRIAAVGNRQSAVRPLTLDFHFGKEALPQGSLKALAEDTAGLYSRLRTAATLFLHNLMDEEKPVESHSFPAPAVEIKKYGGRVLAIDYPYLVAGETLKALERQADQFRTVELSPQALNNPASAGEFIHRLLETVREFKPDLLFSVNHLGFDSEGVLVGELERLKVKSAVYYVDSPFLIMSDPEKMKSPLQTLFLWDSYYVERLRRQGFENVHYLPLATEPNLFRPAHDPRFREEVNYSLVYVADSLSGAMDKYFNRLPAEFSGDDIGRRFAELRKSNSRIVPEMLEALADELGIGNGDLRKRFLAGWITKLARDDRLRYLSPMVDLGLTIFGDDGWSEMFAGNVPRFSDPVRYFDQLPVVYFKADINFNWTHPQMPEGMNQRVFDVPATGSFLLTDYRRALEEIFDLETDIAVYRSPEEAADKVRYFLKHPNKRKEMSVRARRKILAHHTYRHRIDEILTIMHNNDSTYNNIVATETKTPAQTAMPGISFKPDSNTLESLIQDFPRKLDVPRELSVHYYSDRSLVIAPERAAWIVTDKVGAHIVQRMGKGDSMGEAAASAAEIFHLDNETVLLKLRMLLDTINRANFREGFDLKKEEDIDRRPRNLQLFLTRRCDLRCRHCYFSAGESMKDELSGEEWKTILRKFSFMGQGNTVTFTGGEPLMRPDFFDIAGEASALGLKVVLLTNGTLIDEEIAERLGDLLDAAQVSLDGVSAAVNDSIRGDGSFEGATRAIRLLLAQKIPVEITSVALPENVKDLEDNLGKFIASFNSTRLTCALGVANPKGRLKKGYNDEGESLVGRVLKRYQGVSWLRNGRFYSGCRIFGCELAKSIVINPQGKIGSCPYLNYTGPGDVRNSDDFSRLVGEDRAWHRQTMKESDKCRNCDLRNFQCGGCKIFGACSEQQKQRSYFRMMEGM